MHAKWSSWVFQAPARILPAADRPDGQQQLVFLFLPSIVRVLYFLYGTWPSTGASSSMEARAGILISSTEGGCSAQDKYL